MISPVAFAPGMDMGTLITALNNNFNQIANENRTKIIKDENGVNRILIGKDPNGKYIIAITKSGFDVLTELSK